MKTSLSLLAVLSAISMSSCETEVPNVDNTPPDLFFEIWDDQGFRFTYDSDEIDPDTEVKLYLTDGGEYTFLFTAHDSGGVEKAEFGYFEGMFTMMNPIEPTYEFNPSQIISKIIWRGVESSPVNIGIIGNRFEVITTTSPESEVYVINLNANDFTLDDEPFEYEKNGINRNIYVRSGNYDPRVEMD